MTHTSHLWRRHVFCANNVINKPMTYTAGARQTGAITGNAAIGLRQRDETRFFRLSFIWQFLRSYIYNPPFKLQTQHYSSGRTEERAEHARMRDRQKEGDTKREGDTRERERGEGDRE